MIFYHIIPIYLIPILTNKYLNYTIGTTIMQHDLQLFEELAPMAQRRVVVVIGRFNPPTKGHYEIFRKARQFASTRKDLNLHFNPVVVVIGGSKSDADKKRNPLTVHERIQFMTASGHADGVIFKDATNAHAALSKLRDDGYEPIAIVAGSDRADDYLRILDKYFKAPDGSDIKHYKIEIPRENTTNTDMQLADLKSNETIDTDAISASLARRAVELGYEDEFLTIVGLENKPSLGKKLFNRVKKAMNTDDTV